MYLSSTFDTTLGDELDAIRSSIAAFAQDRIAPRAEEIDRTNTFPLDLWPEFGKLGALGATIGEEYGGAGLGYLAHVVIMEEVSRASASVGLSYGAHSNLCANNLALNGTEAQKHKYLPGLCDGTQVGALAMSEPDAGSDVLGSMRCTAKLNGDVWVANGSKMWITNGTYADTLIVYMRTDADTGPGSVTAFLVEKGFAGFHTEPHLDKFGMRGSPTCELVFSNCEIPTENVLGEPGKGSRVLMKGLDSERLVLSGGPLGIMQAAFDLTLPYVTERKQFGQPIGSFQLMQGKLADMYVRLQSARAFTYRVAAALDAGRPSRADSAASLLHSSDGAVELALEAMQSLGGLGYVNESPAGRLVRDAKLYTIGAGTNEIRRMLIGREILGHYEA
ncbi:MAG: acyl-CoA dehydrogenase family protein, partial [Acidimicrobiia bacterium]